MSFKNCTPCSFSSLFCTVNLMEAFSHSSSDSIPTQHINVNKNKLNYNREFTGGLIKADT